MHKNLHISKKSSTFAARFKNVALLTVRVVQKSPPTKVYPLRNYNYAFLGQKKVGYAM